jgi:hypothetical protein
MHCVAYVVFAMLRKSVWFVRVSSSLVLYVIQERIRIIVFETRFLSRYAVG